MARTLILALLCCVSMSVLAAEAELVEVDSEFFYEIGGEYVLPSGYTSRTDINLALRGTATLGYSCGKFDPKLALRNAFNNLRDELQDTQDAIVNAATASVAALPMYLLQRANPDAASLLKNYEFDLGQKINLATQSCEQLERDILENGTNPFGRWATFGKMATWKSGVESGETVREAETSVREDSGHEGIDWGGEKAGGRSQPPIVLNHDVSMFGYNRLLGRALRDESSARDLGDRISTVFPTPKTLTEFVQEVVGDTEISVTEAEGPMQTIPPKGLHNAIESRRQEIEQLIVEILRAEADESVAVNELRDLQLTGAVLTTGLIDGISQLSEVEQQATISKLASEFAMHEIIDKALLALRAMHAGQLTPDVVNSPAYDQFQQSIAQLEEEVRWLEFEMTVRDRLLTETPIRVVNNVSGSLRYNVPGKQTIEYVTPQQKPVSGRQP